MILYYAEMERRTVVPVECEEHPSGLVRYLSNDARGRTVYSNSHFQTPEAAWEHLRRDAQAGANLLASRIREARERLRELEKEAAESIVEIAEVADHFEEWQRTGKLPEVERREP